MQPELMRALAREHRAELLRQKQFRHSRTPLAPGLVTGTREQVQVLRRAAGTVLVQAGARLIGGNVSAIDLFNSPE